MIPGAAAPRGLVVVRHAKAESWGPSDHERALTGVGRAEAAATGEFLASSGVRPDLALVSDATRTRQTWAAMAGAAGWGLSPTCDRAVYTAGTESALALLRAVDAASTVVLVGHNPTMVSLAHLLDDGEGEANASTDMLVRGFATSAAALFAIDRPWGELGPGGGALRAFHAGHAER